MARGVPTVVLTGLGMSALDTVLFIMCAVCSLSWLLVVGWAWGGCTCWPQAGHLMTMGFGGASNSSIMSLIMAGAGGIGSLARGHYLCMAGVSLALGSHVSMGASLCSGAAGGDTVSGALGLQGCRWGSGSHGVTLPKRRA